MPRTPAVRSQEFFPKRKIVEALLHPAANICDEARTAQMVSGQIARAAVRRRGGRVFLGQTALVSIDVCCRASPCCLR